jgi:GT2 family glycosyltransferase
MLRPGNLQCRIENLDISIIIVNWNTRELLLDCLRSIFRTIHGISFEIWLVDNASTDGSVENVQSLFPDLYVIKNEKNLGFAAANNLAFKSMNGRYALLLNTDTVLTEDAVRKLYDFMESTPQAGLSCGQLLNQDDSKQNSIANFPSLFSLLCNETLLRILFPKKFPSKRQIYASPVEIDSCIGACMMARKQAMDEVGLFDERYFFFFEETDWARRMKRSGWKVYFVPGARIYHAQGQSVGRTIRSRLMFYRARYLYFVKWYPRAFPLFFAAVILRLLVEACLSSLGILVTLGLAPGLRKKWLLYLQLIFWHLKGCPDPV